MIKITEPTLLVDEEKCRRNIQRMVNKAKKSGATLRPHFKTHQSSTVAEWCRAFSIDRCTVSSVSMAKYFFDHGWHDITIAFPYNPLESDGIDEMAGKASVNILIESEQSLDLAQSLLSNPLGYFIKIDVGAHRTGIGAHEQVLIEKLVADQDDKLAFKGFLAHAGHTYKCRDQEDIRGIYAQSVNQLLPLKEKFGGIISWGDTPTCSVVEDLSAIDEVRAGNFIFYDWMQKQISSCTIKDVAVCVACPVVAIHPEREEVVVYGGGAHLSKDFLEEEGNISFGKAVTLTGNGWSTEIIGNVDRLSQEHGIIKLPQKTLAHLKIGDLIGVIPVHSCLTADLQGHYYSTAGQRIEKIVKT